MIRSLKLQNGPRCRDRAPPVINQNEQNDVMRSSLQTLMNAGLSFASQTVSNIAIDQTELEKLKDEIATQDEIILDLKQTILRLTNERDEAYTTTNEWTEKINAQASVERELFQQRLSSLAAQVAAALPITSPGMAASIQGEIEKKEQQIKDLELSSSLASQDSASLSGDSKKKRVSVADKPTKAQPIKADPKSIKREQNASDASDSKSDSKVKKK
jgi:hypothetical protein